MVAGGNVYQIVPKQGLFVMHVENGGRVWNRPEGGQLLGQIGDDVYLLATEGSRSILRVSAANGRRKEEARVPLVEFGVAGLADQSIFLANSMGDLVCLRPANAPRLKPEEVEAALRNDRKMQMTAEMGAKAAEARKKVAAPAVKAKSRFEDEDSLASRSTAKPVGGHGVLKEPGKPAAAGEKPAAAKAKPGNAEGEAEEPKEGEEAKEGEEGAKAVTEGEEGEEKAAEKGGEEATEGKEAGPSDEKGAGATTKKADEEGEKEEGGDDEGGEKEGGG